MNRKLVHALLFFITIINGAFLSSVISAQESKAERNDETVNLTYLFSDGNMTGTLSAYRSLLQENPELEGKISLQFLTESFFDETEPAEIIETDVLILDMMNQSMLDRFNETFNTDLLEQVSSNGEVLAVGSGIQPLEYYTEQGALWDETAMAYWQNGGLENQLSLMKYALEQAGITGLQIASPRPSLEFGYYYSAPNGGQVFANWEDFNRWRSQNNKTGENKPRVAIGFYGSSFYSSETEVIDALIAEVESQGAEVIPFFGYPGHIAFKQMLLDENGDPRADVALSLLLRFADFEASQILANVDIPIINLITLYGRSEQEWRDSATGLSLFEGTFQVAVPELAGLIAPTVVGSRERQFDPATGITIVVNKPIAPRIEIAARRALRYANLGSTANQDKKVALMYYNYPVGKSNIGASYLNVADSLSNILSEMRIQGYDLDNADLSAESILRDITTGARNVASFAPGELAEMLANDNVARIPVELYKEWLSDYDPQLKAKIIADWGEAETVELMTVESDGEKFFIIPRIEYGNIILMPQPARGWSEDLEKLYHADDLAPHHQYVAAYTWLRKEAGIDALIHIGTHGTLEWLDGKDAGLSNADASDALMADIPNLYIYNVDVVGEGLVARRRGMATLLDHMVPPFVQGDLYPELAELGESINDFDINYHKNPELAEVFKQQIIEQAINLGIEKALGLDLHSDNLQHNAIHEIQDYIFTLKEQFIPFGLHAFGRLPTEEMRQNTVAAIVAVDRSLLPDQKTVFAEDMDERIITSANREIESLIHALNGAYITGGNGGEPIRNPDAYPTGKNFYGIDPDKIPKKAAWALGVELADQMLAQHLSEHGEYPQKISFVIWGDETMRHEGVLESQIFHLMGTIPVWDERNKVVGVDIIPTAKLGRPRVDILIASAAEGMFNNVTVLMDQAVQKVKALEEADNFVRDHYLASKAALIKMGYSEEDADQRAGVRIFDEPPGIYNLNTSNIAAASGSWDSDIGMANDYINKMGHGFGNGFWGEPMQDVFKLALDGVEKVVHSSSTMLYGALDNDDFYMYMGGLAAAVRTVDGKSPELLVTNTRNPGSSEMSTIDKFIGMEFQSRYINPTWIVGMQSEGYAGARTMVEFVEYLWGWDATVTDVVNDQMWQDTFEVYVQDKYSLDMQNFFENESPYAFQDMSARMLETIRKQYWDADEKTLSELLSRYVNSVNEFGISCTEVSCGNPRLMKYVLEESESLNLSGVDLAAFRAAVEQAIRGNIEQLAQAAENFSESNDSIISEAYASAKPGLDGFKMERINNTPEQERAPSSSREPDGQAYSLLVQIAILLLLLFWWQKRRLQNTE